MTKHEKIKSVYGKYYDDWKDDINDNGFLETMLPLPNIMIEELQLKKHTICTYTPIELIGIEFNNGWIKIESESDLPKETGTYWVIDKFMETNPERAFYEVDSLISLNTRWLYRFTHYQPIEMPKPPIY